MDRICRIREGNFIPQAREHEGSEGKPGNAALRSGYQSRDCGTVGSRPAGRRWRLMGNNLLFAGGNLASEQLRRLGISSASASPCSMLQHRFALLNLRPSLRIDESQEELSVPQARDCKQKLFPLLATGRIRWNGCRNLSAGKRHRVHGISFYLADSAIMARRRLRLSQYGWSGEPAFTPVVLARRNGTVA